MEDGTSRMSALARLTQESSHSRPIEKPIVRSRDTRHFGHLGGQAFTLKCRSQTVSSTYCEQTRRFVYGLVDGRELNSVLLGSRLSLDHDHCKDAR